MYSDHLLLTPVGEQGISYPKLYEMAEHTAPATEQMRLTAVN